MTKKMQIIYTRRPLSIFPFLILFDYSMSSLQSPTWATCVRNECEKYQNSNNQLHDESGRRNVSGRTANRNYEPEPAKLAELEEPTENVTVLSDKIYDSMLLLARPNHRVKSKK
jgi:hypothetical protein